MAQITLQTLNSLRSLVTSRGNDLMSEIDARRDGDMDLEQAIDATCTDVADYGCLVAALIEGLEEAGGLLDAITRAAADCIGA